MSSVHLRGHAAAPGVVVAPAWHYAPASVDSTELGIDPLAGEPRIAIQEAAATAGRQLETLARRMHDIGRGDDAGIFEAQSVMALDPMLLGDAVHRAEAGETPAGAVRAAAAAAAEIIASIDDDLLAARAADVRDVGARIIRVLTGRTLDLPQTPVVAIADDLPPSITAEIPPGFLLGVALSGGSRTSHAVILSRGLGIPAVVGTAGLLEFVSAAGQDALLVAMDGDTGEVVLDPTALEVEGFQARAVALEERRATAAGLRGRPCATSDGVRVTLVANIGSPDDAARALDAMAEGIGLFRTEFLFMRRQTAPTETEQVAAYSRTLAAFGPERPVVIRLADIGGDKAIPYLNLPVEANPFLGVRGIRLAYDSRDLLRTQLRAIWRASATVGVVPHVMAPMVATTADVDLLCSLRDEAREDLVAEGLPCGERMVTGIMIEVPSAAIQAADLARMVDFFSIGTNDLTQYLFAADRSNASLGQFQDAMHPVVLETISRVVQAAHAAGIRTAVCGELAGDPQGALVLVGLGVDELSADAGSLDGVRAALAAVTRSDVDELARSALAAGDADEARLVVGRRPGRS